MAFDIDDWKNAVTAANYIGETEDGFVIGNMQDDDLLGNVLITPEPAIYMRDGDTIIAYFNENAISIGGNSTASVIKMVGDTLSFSGMRTAGVSQTSFIDVKPDTSNDNPFLYLRAFKGAYHTDIVLGKGIAKVVDYSLSGTRYYPIIREPVTVVPQTGITSMTASAYLVGGMCFVYGVLHNSSAGTGQLLGKINGVVAADPAPFPVACYSGNSCEGWVEGDYDNYCTNIKFNLTSEKDWRFNFAFPVM